MSCSFSKANTLNHKLKYILSFLLFLSLAGLGENISISVSNVKHSKETEWVSKTNLNAKESKSFYYNLSIDHTATILDLTPWSIECILFYNQKLNVKLITLTRKFCEIDLISLIINKSYFPRKSIEIHNFSC